MKIQRWRQIEDLLDAALESKPSDRDQLLESACATDAELRREVESLLAHQASAENFIETSAFSLAAEILADDQDEGQFKDKQIGAYRIIREIGRGGMGAVFLAERSDGEFQHTVALKVVRRSFADSDLTRRFRQERQILASLNHPNIARLFDGGVSADGEPFLAMEYVEGVRIDDYCNVRNLPTDERLKLFLAVCRGVSYAHQNLVVHRDIKPSNIQVTNEGVPKLLDFGIAKLVSEEASGGAETVTGLRAMTPDYASPEQVRGLQVTTATDIYGLGILLYELLTGCRPFHLKNRSAEEIARAICEEEPERPSTAISRVGEVPGQAEKTHVAPSAETISRVRRRSLEHLQRALRGDLDRIVLMAIRKETERRYASVQEFADDIRRHLEGLPVVAHKDTFQYRAGKFIRRNKIAVAASALIFLTLLGGVTFSWIQFRNSQRQRAKAEAVNEFLQRMLASAEPGSNVAGKSSRETTVNDILEVTAKSLESEDLSSEPEVKAELLQIIGASYLSQGRYDLAEKHVSAALEAKTKLYGGNSPDTLKALVIMAKLLLLKADYVSAEVIYQRRLSILRTEFKKGKIKAEVLIEALNDYALLRRARGDSREAEALLREAVSLEPQVPAEAKSYIRQVETVLALTLLDEGKFDEAEERARNFVDEFRQLADTETLEMCQALTLLGSVLLEKGELAEADTNLREGETRYRKLLDENALPIYDNLRLQAQSLYLQGKLTEAEEKIERTLENYRRNSKQQYISYATALTIQGLILNKSGKTVEAERVLREAVELRKQNLPKEHFMSALTNGALGEALLSQKRFAEAEPLLLESYQNLKLSQVTENTRVLLAKRRLSELYTAWGKPGRFAA